ncbi:hypothetical protein AKJ09_08114 [Labilithrix luteola]|uniref:Uncharacterized protein n=1 Tax=Labilithrix luteola TaxID=1391654 RepID=A0A0K1Q6I6_9BACT|nr:hypothetical protein [Labilithrix luteola]AKV01451.1 hypothetical protein AKJ09_08114 [Labilithrix luteola]
MFEPRTRPTDSRSSATLMAYAALVMTSLHHAYGAFRYDTPWRMHAAIVAVIGGGAIALAARVYDARPDAPRGRVAGWVLVALVLVLVGIGLGTFEGFYNHVVKNALFFGGASVPTMHRLYPPPAYELPDDAIFELTGIAQTIPALLAAIAAVRLGARLLRRETLPGVLSTD